MSAQPISEARLAANRANAAKSTGPKTPEGKAAVANNAYKHGLRSERNPLDLANDTAIPLERKEFLATLAAFMDDLQPQGAIETRLVERLAQLDLRLNRAIRMETAHLDVNATLALHELTAAGCSIATDTGATRDNGLLMMAFLRDPNALTLIGRYESRLARDFAKTLSQFHQSQKLRTANALCASDKSFNQTQADSQRPQHPGTGSSVPSEAGPASSTDAPQSRVDIGACPPTHAQLPSESPSDNSTEQTQHAHPRVKTSRALPLVATNLREYPPVAGQ